VNCWQADSESDSESAGDRRVLVGQASRSEQTEATGGWTQTCGQNLDLPEPWRQGLGVTGQWLSLHSVVRLVQGSVRGRLGPGLTPRHRLGSCSGRTRNLGTLERGATRPQGFRLVPNADNLEAEEISDYQVADYPLQPPHSCSLGIHNGTPHARHIGTYISSRARQDRYLRTDLETSSKDWTYHLK
jgi:hypothetical protein